MLISTTYITKNPRITCAPLTPSNEDRASVSLTGQTLIDLGQNLDSPLLLLVGMTINNLKFEFDVLGNISNSRSKTNEYLILEICRRHLCSDWNEWSKCNATTLGEFGSQNRSRNCGFNSTIM